MMRHRIAGRIAQLLTLIAHQMAPARAGAAAWATVVDDDNYTMLVRWRTEPGADGRRIASSTIHCDAEGAVTLVTHRDEGGVLVRFDEVAERKVYDDGPGVTPVVKQ